MLNILELAFRLNLIAVNGTNVTLTTEILGVRIGTHVVRDCTRQRTPINTSQLYNWLIYRQTWWNNSDWIRGTEAGRGSRKNRASHQMSDECFAIQNEIHQFHERAERYYWWTKEVRQLKTWWSNSDERWEPCNRVIFWVSLIGAGFVIGLTIIIS